jgi:predicted ATPase
MAEPGRAGVTSPVTVGRDREIARLERAFEAAAAGTPRVVVIGGEAGVGKTRLVADACRRLESEGALVLTGGCVAFGPHTPYLPVVEILRAIVRDIPPTVRDVALGPARRELALLLPELDPFRRARAATGAEPDASATGAEDMAAPDASAGLARLRLFEGLLGVVERLSAARPTVVVLEDLQWADEATLALLVYLVRSMRRGRLLVIATLRPEEAKGPALGVLADLERAADVLRIELASLSLDGTAQLVGSILGRRAAPGFVERLHGLSGGNPFYAEELLAAGIGDGEHLGLLSPRLRDVLRARTAALSEDAMALLRTMSIAGRSLVDASLLASTTSMAPEAFDRALRTVLEHQLVVLVRDGQGPAYRFRHELLRAFVSDGVLPSEGARIHARFAEALSAGSGARASAGELAMHRDAAGDVPRAFAAHLEAASDAERAFAFEAASRHLERALVLHEHVDAEPGETGPDPLHLAQRAADAAGRAGDVERAIELTREVLASAGVRTDDLLEYMRSNLRWLLWLLGRLDEAVAEAEATLARPAAALSARWRANALSHLAGLLMSKGDNVAARSAPRGRRARGRRSRSRAGSSDGASRWPGAWTRASPRSGPCGTRHSRPVRSTSRAAPLRMRSSRPCSNTRAGSRRQRMRESRAPSGRAPTAFPGPSGLAQRRARRGLYTCWVGGTRPPKSSTARSTAGASAPAGPRS